MSEESAPYLAPLPAPAGGPAAEPQWLRKARRRAAAHHSPLASQGATYDRHQLLRAYDDLTARLTEAQHRHDQADNATLYYQQRMNEALAGRVEAERRADAAQALLARLRESCAPEPVAQAGGYVRAAWRAVGRNEQRQVVAELLGGGRDG